MTASSLHRQNCLIKMVYSSPRQRWRETRAVGELETRHPSMRISHNTLQTTANFPKRQIQTSTSAKALQATPAARPLEASQRTVEDSGQ